MADTRVDLPFDGDARLSDEPSSATAVPRLLRDAAAWSWRLLLVAGAVYVVWLLLSEVALLVLALLGAFFFTALLEPFVHLIARVLPRALAAILAVLLLIGGLGLLGWFVVARAGGDVASIVDEASGLVTQLGDVLNMLPNSSDFGIDQIEQSLLNYLADNRATLAMDAISGARQLVEVGASAVLGIFFLIYFLYDGAGIWRFVVGLAPEQRRVRIDGAGYRAWRRVGGFVRGTTLIALFHAVFVGALLVLLGVPLAIPLSLLIFVGSFLPIIGAFLFGGLALLVTLLTQGIGPGLIFLGVLVLDNQIEAHVLQPFLVGRYVKLHPVAVALALSGGGLVAGVPGAVFAVPLVSAFDGAFRTLREVPTSARRHPEREPADKDDEDDEDDG